MAKFHSLKVAEIIRETADAVSIVFEIPEEFKNDYSYKSGQYVTLKMKVNGEELRRSYSICSSPVADNELRIAIKKVKDGRMSSCINDSLKVGEVIEVLVPMGNFHSEMKAEHQKNYVLFAGGSGITPMLSILKTVLKSEPKSTITLFYGNYDETSIIFKKQIDAIVEANPAIKVFYILDNAPTSHPILLQGLMTKEKNLSLLENYVNIKGNNEYFICGPGIMMDNVKAALTELKINEERIHIEYFTTPVKEEDLQKPIVETASGATAKIIIDGDEHSVALEDNETILEAAMRIGLDAPFACQGGSCCTCRALLQEGKVDMAVNYALSASEVKQGFILTCQSRATTPTVTVNYDKGL